MQANNITAASNSFSLFTSLCSVAMCFLLLIVLLSIFIGCWFMHYCIWSISFWSKLKVIKDRFMDRFARPFVFPSAVTYDIKTRWGSLSLILDCSKGKVTYISMLYASFPIDCRACFDRVKTIRSRCSIVLMWFNRSTDSNFFILLLSIFLV